MTKAESGAVFERYESKYLLSGFQHQRLGEMLQGHMARDQYGRHTICTIYYDTRDFDIIRHCLSKPGFKEKLRLRSYGVPKEGQTVYLELKKKLSGITYKRRVPLTLEEAGDYLSGGAMPEGKGQILREIDWYMRQRDTQPRVLISYDRVALHGLEDPAFRLTIDANIRWRDSDLRLDQGDQGQALLLPGNYLMEVKTLNALPLWFTRILSGLKIYPISFSKYGNIYQQLSKEQTGKKEDILYAV